MLPLSGGDATTRRSSSQAERRLRAVSLALPHDGRRDGNSPAEARATQLVAAATNAAATTVPPDPQLHMDVEETSGDNCGPDSSRPDRFFHPVAARPYSATSAPLNDVGALAAAVRENGFVVLRSVLPATLIASCRAAFEPRLAEYLQRKGSAAAPNRGPNRHYIDLPMRAPFVDMLANQTISKLVHELLGPDAFCDSLASDTPTGRGSTYQCVHGDFGMHDGGEVPDLYAINWPLADVTEQNGPFEMAVGGKKRLLFCPTTFDNNQNDHFFTKTGS